MTKKYDELVIRITFVGFAIICCILSLLIAAEIMEPLDNVELSSILLAVSAYVVLDWLLESRKNKEKDKDETEQDP